MPQETGLESVVTVTLISVFYGRVSVSLLSENTLRHIMRSSKYELGYAVKS